MAAQRAVVLAFGNGVASDGALLHKGNPCLRSPQNKHYIACIGDPLFDLGAMEESIIEKAIVGIQFRRNRQREHGDVTTCSRD